MAKVGRKTKLNDEVQQTIYELLSDGITDKDACDAVNIHVDTFYTWLKRGSEGEKEFAEFSEAVTRARANAKITAIETLRSAFKSQREVRETTETTTETRLNRKGEAYEYTKSETVKTIILHPPDWKAAAEYLKRKHRDEWSERSEVTGKDGDALLAPYVFLPQTDDDDTNAPE